MKHRGNRNSITNHHCIAGIVASVGLVTIVILLILPWTNPWVSGQNPLVQFVFFSLITVFMMIVIMTVMEGTSKGIWKHVVFGTLLMMIMDIILPDYCLQLGWGPDFGHLATSTATGFSGRTDYVLAWAWNLGGVPEGVLLVIFTYPISTLILMVLAKYIYGARGMKERMANA